VTDQVSDLSHPTSIADLKPKMRLQGTVKAVQLYGAVVDIGISQDGLVHISQLAPARTNRVSDVVSPGDVVTVWVTRVDPEKGRVGLTMVEPPAVDWSELSEGQTITGTVTRMERYGAFVDIGTERAGLLHVREMSSGYVRDPSEILSLGESVEVRIAKIDRRKKRVDLSMIGIQPQIQDDEEPPTKTAMEIALTQARDQKQGPNARRRKQRSKQLDERNAILTRTLRDHSQRN